jgi:hypothetical protein
MTLGISKFAVTANSRNSFTISVQRGDLGCVLQETTEFFNPISDLLKTLISSYPTEIKRSSIR